MSDQNIQMPHFAPMVAPPSVVLPQNDAAAPSTSILNCCSAPQSAENGADPALTMSSTPQIGKVRFASTGTTIVTRNGVISFDEFLKKGAPVDQMLIPPFPQVSGIPMFEDGTPDIATIHSTCNIVNLSQTSQTNTVPHSDIGTGASTPLPQDSAR
ncbi:alveolin domain containing intermediate filament IMC3 [Cryptosporidium felis]|nr:alveolin domain containing intermediate filament IMC3 [Cryptosporidium felis]